MQKLLVSISSLFVVFASFGCAPNDSEPLEAKLEEGMAIQSVYFRSAKRTAGSPNIPDNALWKAILAREALVDPTDGAGVYPGGWTWLGPGNIGGRVREVLIHPANTNIMWTGGLSGGIWKTTNAGGTWTQMDDYMGSLPIGCMALDKLNPNVLYVGTGEGFFETVEGSSNTAAVRGAGIFKSIDGGQTWTQIPSTLGSDWHFVNRIAIQPGNSNNILAATQSGIWRSTDAGATWTRTSTGIAYDLRFHPTDGTRAIAGFHDEGAKITTNGGVSWTASTGLGTPHRTEVCYAPSTPTTIYAACSAANRIRIYRSTNSGASFTLMTTGTGISTYEAYNNVLWVDPANANNLIVGGVSLYRSSNSGTTLTQGFGNVHSDMHSITTDPNFNGTTNKRIFFGTDGGIYRANDHASNTVTELNNNLGITQFYGAVLNPANGQIVGGTQDNGTIRATNNPEGWASIFGGDGVYCEYDPTDVNYWYGGVYYAQIFRSTTGGPGGAYIYNGITDAGSSTTCNFIPYMSLDPNEPNRFLIGARSLWRSDNVKAATPTWTAIKPTIQPGGRPGRGTKLDDSHMNSNPPWNISTFMIAPGNSDLIWVGYNNGEVWKTTNGTAATPTWTRHDNIANPLPDRWVGAIRIDPADNNRIYVGFMGYNGDNLWRSTDGGTTWTEISGNLPDVPISAVSTHPTNSDWVYVGTDVGLFTSSDMGATWTTQNQGPGNVPIEEIRWPTATKMLLVTHGRGAYSADIPNPDDEPNSPFSFVVTVGTHDSGRINELYSSDNARVIATRSGSPNDLVYPLGIVFNFRSPHAAVSALSFKLEGHVSGSGYGQIVSMYNWDTLAYEQIDARYATTADSVAIATPTGDLNRFVHDATRDVKVLVTYQPWASDTFGPWSARIDHVVMTVRD